MAAHVALDNLADIVCQVSPTVDLCPSFHAVLFRRRVPLASLFLFSNLSVVKSFLEGVYGSNSFVVLGVYISTHRE